VLETTRYIECFANTECDPAVLLKPIDLSSQDIEGLTFCMAVKQHNHAGRNGA
jgi:hypothetical protein